MTDLTTDDHKKFNDLIEELKAYKGHYNIITESDIQILEKVNTFFKQINEESE